MAVPTIEALIISPSESRVLGALTAVEVNVLVMLSSSLGVRLLQGSRRWGRVLSMGRWDRAGCGYGTARTALGRYPLWGRAMTGDFAMAIAWAIAP